ncbi:Pirin [hydrothermal vent metagenome]|uniref:Pirin n=1 Tax=hydrothermal vent metagenome TaxID=652676 RepID=A0A3B0VXI2_9ZZZZ
MLIQSIRPLGFQWETQDPFLFCAHHQDIYPEGNKFLGPNTSLEGRAIGQDFTLKDGWRMYHGSKVPGFPAHPHRGFETVTYVRTGLVDHSDSLGATGRFGNGDVQWMTAGRGVQHSEMFPLLNQEKPNPFELFQIWLNLPKASKFVEAHYKMLWREDLPCIMESDDNGNSVELSIIAGDYKINKALAPTPDSWAANPKNDVAIWAIKLSPNANWALPKALAETNRTLYYYEGESLVIQEQSITGGNAINLIPDKEIIIKNGSQESNLLLLQGRPINEPVAKYGPFVMNTQSEIAQTMDDYQRTQFGGWPWDSHERVNDKEKGRFAKYADGTEDIR